MRFAAVVPVLPIFDEAKAREFYLGFLGFAIVFEHRFAADLPLDMGVRRGACDLHLGEHHGDALPGSTSRVEVDDIDAPHTELAAKACKFIRPGIEAKPWGTRQITVGDPFGNRIVFCAVATSRHAAGTA